MADAPKESSAHRHAAGSEESAAATKKERAFARIDLETKALSKGFNVFPAVGEQNNGVNNSALNIPAGQSGIFVRVPNNIGTAGWRSVAIP